MSCVNKPHEKTDNDKEKTKKLNPICYKDSVLRMYVCMQYLLDATDAHQTVNIKKQSQIGVQHKVLIISRNYLGVLGATARRFGSQRPHLDAINLTLIDSVSLQPATSQSCATRSDRFDPI